MGKDKEKLESAIWNHLKIAMAKNVEK